MSSLLPTRLSWACTRYVSRVCQCGVRGHVVRYASTKSASKKQPRPVVQPVFSPPPAGAAGSAALQPQIPMFTPEDAIERIKVTETADECLMMYRQAGRKNILTIEVQRATLRVLIARGNMDEALRLARAFDKPDLLSHMILAYGCAVKKRIKDFKDQVEQLKNISGVETLALGKLHSFLGIEESTKKEGKKEGTKEKTKEGTTEGTKEDIKEDTKEDTKQRTTGETIIQEASKGKTEGTAETQKGGSEKAKEDSNEETKVKCTPLEAYTAMLEDSVSLGDLEFATYILQEIENAGLNKDTHYTQLMHALGAAGHVDAAARVLQRMGEAQVNMEHPATFVQAVWIYCGTNQLDKALRLFEEVRKGGVALEDYVPNMLHVLVQHDLDAALKILHTDGPHAGADAYAVVARALMWKPDLERAVLLLREVERLRLPLTKSVTLTAIKLFDKTGHVQNALKWVGQYVKEGEKVDEEMEVAIVTILCHHGMIKQALYKMKELRQKEKLTLEIYNAMLSGLIKHGFVDESIRMVTQHMKEDGVKPDAQSFTALLGCIKFGRLKAAEEILKTAEKEGVEPTPQMQSAIAIGAAESGNFLQAWETIEKIVKMPKTKEVDLLHTFNGVLQSMVTAGKSVSECEELLKRMLANGVYPNSETYENIIRCHINEGTLETAFGLFDKLKELGMKPTLKTIKKLQQACIYSSNMEWFIEHVGK